MLSSKQLVLAQTPARSARVQPFKAAAAARRPSRAMAVRATASYELDPDNASILVCGGGGVALSVTRKLKDMGSWVWMMQRTDVRKSEIEKMMAFVPKGDALSKEDVQKVFDGALLGASGRGGAARGAALRASQHREGIGVVVGRPTSCACSCRVHIAVPPMPGGARDLQGWI